MYGQFHAARALLPVDTLDPVDQRDFGYADRAGLPDHSGQPGVPDPQAARHAVRLDVHCLRRVHPGLRRHPRDGCV
ncbi:conserved hypothetical protein, partial [Ricinus communis]